MMGMGNTAYWLSWYTYYTVISVSIAVIAWILINFVVFSTSNPLILLLFLVVFGQSLFGIIIFI